MMTNQTFNDLIYTESCTICKQTYGNREDDVVQGILNSIPITFCHVCFASICIMVDDIRGDDE